MEGDRSVLRGMNRKQRLWFWMVCWIAVSATGSAGGQEHPAQALPGTDSLPPLRSAHSHNDYWRGNPLHDALAAGFCSVEADLFLVNGELLVGHSRVELKRDRTLESLYLAPLRERIRAEGGAVHAGHPDCQFWLHLDVKTGARETFQAIQTVLVRYADLIEHDAGGRTFPGPLRIVISGNRDYWQIAFAHPRLAGIDGRMTDLESGLGAVPLPLLSDRWGSLFQWQGVGPMPEEERRRLQSIVDRAHAAGRKVRFWATPENPAVWQQLREAGVDFLNTDQLQPLAAFLRHETGSPPSPAPAGVGGPPR